MPDRPSRQPFQNSSTLLPRGVRAPRPVITMRRDLGELGSMLTSLLSADDGRVRLQAQDVGPGLAREGDGTEDNNRVRWRREAQGGVHGRRHARLPGRLDAELAEDAGDLLRVEGPGVVGAGGDDPPGDWLHRHRKAFEVLVAHDADDE